MKLDSIFKCAAGAILIILPWSTVHAQRTLKEVTKSTNRAEDSKPNSPGVPPVFSIDSQFEKIMLLRFKYRTDLLAGLDSVVKAQNIRNAVILAAAGSVCGYHVHVVSNNVFPSKNIYMKDPDAPADINNMNGYVIDGRVHVHITLADSEKTFGGHLEKGTEVFTFAIVTLGILPDSADLRRVDDKNYR